MEGLERIDLVVLTALSGVRVPSPEPSFFSGQSLAVNRLTDRDPAVPASRLNPHVPRTIPEVEVCAPSERVERHAWGGGATRGG